MHRQPMVNSEIGCLIIDWAAGIDPNGTSVVNNILINTRHSPELGGPRGNELAVLVRSKKFPEFRRN